MKRVKRALKRARKLLAIAWRYRILHTSLWGMVAIYSGYLAMSRGEYIHVLGGLIYMRFAVEGATKSEEVTKAELAALEAEGAELDAEAAALAAEAAALKAFKLAFLKKMKRVLH